MPFLIAKADAAYDRVVDALFLGSLWTVCKAARAAGRRGGLIRAGSAWALRAIGSSPSGTHALTAVAGLVLQQISPFWP
jgi:hypothetical protein